MSAPTDMVELCPSCGQKLRWPTHLGPLIVTCPPCRHRWDWQIRAPLARAEPVDDAGSRVDDLFSEVAKVKDFQTKAQSARKPVAIQFVPVREFENTKEFFEGLSKEIEGGQPVTVETPYEKESEFPDELQQYIKAEAGGPVAVSLARRPAVVVPSAAAVGGLLGLGVAALLGGQLAVVGAGVGVGAVLGLVTGAVSTTLSSGSHRIEIVVDMHGKLIIRFNPVTAAPEAQEKAG